VTTAGTLAPMQIRSTPVKRRVHATGQWVPVTRKPTIGLFPCQSGEDICPVVRGSASVVVNGLARMCPGGERMVCLRSRPPASLQIRTPWSSRGDRGLY